MGVSRNTHILRAAVRSAFIVMLITGFSHTSHASSLAEIYEKAVTNDSQLKAAQAAYLANSQAKDIGRSQLLPQINAVLNYAEEESQGANTQVLGQNAVFGRRGHTDSDTKGYQITLTQPLFDLPAWFSFKRGNALSEKAKLQFAADQQALILRTTDAYFEVLRARENLTSAIAEEKAIKRQTQQTRERFEVGLLPITDVHEAQSAYDTARVNTLELRSALDIAFEALTVLTGEPYQRLSGLIANIPITPPEPANPQQWVDFAMTNNYQLRTSRAEVIAAEQQAKSKRYEHAPKLTGTLNYYDDESDNEFRGRDSSGFFKSPSNTDREGHSIAIQLKIPIFSGGLVSAERKQAYHQLVQAQETLAANQRNITQQARSNHLQVLTNAARVKARKLAIKSANSALEATKAGYEAGTRNVVDVLLAERTLYQAKRDYSNARFDYIQSHLRLKDVSGQLSPEDIYQLNAWLDPNIAVTKAGLQ